MSVPLYNVENEKTGEISIPRVFQTPLRPDVIKKAVLTQQSHGYQPQGRDPMAGKRTSAESWGTGRGMARVPRLKGSSRAAFGVSIVGGHQAFPPNSNKKIRKEINKKERRLAIRSGIAVTGSRGVVASRGHIVDSVTQLPLVVEDEIQSLQKSKELKDLLLKFGLWDDVERADRKKIRAGRGKTRGRKKKIGKGPMIVINEDLGIVKAGSNLPGVDIVKLKNLNAELLAPGTHAGRLVLWTESAFKDIDNFWGEVS